MLQATPSVNRLALVRGTALMQFMLRWPTSAFLSWTAAWLGLAGLRQFGLDPLWALALASAACLVLALFQPVRWRRFIVAGGFGLSLLLSGRIASLPGLPSWAWLLPLLLLVLLYPRSSWRDAPLFPTPAAGLDGLNELVVLPKGARVLDAGCGLGHGLAALRRAYPQASLAGIEFSRVLARLAAWRCPWAEVRCGDMWSQDWRGFDLIYVFHRPETMAKAWAKACQEMHANAWFVSLDFEVVSTQPLAVLQSKRGHRVLIYQVPGFSQG